MQLSPNIKIKRKRVHFRYDRAISRVKPFLQIIRFVLLVSFLLASTPNAHWQSYNQGLQQAKTEKKYVLIQFYATWCELCHQMEQDLFTQANLRQKLTAHFVAVRVNLDSNQQVVYQGRHLPEKRLFIEYQAPGPPTMVVLQPDGKVIARIPGLLSAKELDLLLGYIGSGAFRTMNIKAYQKQLSS